MANMPTLKQAIFQNFRGLNQTSDRLNAPPDFLYDLLNGYVKKDVRSNLGVITQREGSKKLNTVQLGSDFGTTKKIRYLTEIKFDTGEVAVVCRAGTAWGVFDDVDTFNAFDTGRADDVPGQAVMFKNALIFVDGGIPRKAEAGGSITDLSADANMPQDSDAVWVNQGKVWLNSVSNPMIAYFCTTNKADGATSWTGSSDAGTIDLSTILPTGDRIRGFRNYGGLTSGIIAIICEKYTVIFTAGSNAYTFSFLQLLPTTCLSVLALDYLGTDIAYPSRDSLTSLYSIYTNNQLEVKTLSDYITNLWRNLVSLTANTEQVSGVFNHTLNHYYITFPITNNYQTLVYSADIKNFVGRWTYPFEIYCWLERRDGTVLTGSNGYAYTMNTGSDDDGTSISFKAALPALYFKDAVHYKKPVEFEALVEATSTLDLNVDYWYGLSTLASDKVTKVLTINSTSSLWDVSLWDVSYWDTQGNALVKTSDLMGRGKMMFLEFRQNTFGASITIFWFRIGYQLEGVN